MSAVETETASTILVVDDTPANLSVMVGYLEHNGLRVVVAQDGAEGLERAARVRPDLILLDVMMPEIDGFETCRRLKADADTQDIPVIFMTALSQTRDLLNGFKVGGIDYITKPYHLDEVLARINTHLKLRALQRRLAEQNRLLQREVASRQEAEREAREACEILKNSEARYRKLVEMMPEAICVIQNESIVFLNTTAARLFGADTAREMTGLSVIDLVSETSRDLLRDRLHYATQDQKATSLRTMQIMRMNGELLEVEVSCAPIAFESAPCVLVAFHDTAEPRRHQVRVEYQATHDLLTGLPNRALYFDRLSQAINTSARRRSRIGVMFIDLDRFKHINDTLGHSAGDEVLKAAAERLKECVRECDTVARLGGDEFVLLLDQLFDENALSQLALRVNCALAEPINLAGQQYNLTCSIGISTFPEDGSDGETLLKRADVAMYRAKETGRNNFQFYTPQMQENLDQRLILEKRLFRALEADEFVLHYQPQLDLRTGRVVGMEALIHWQSLESGRVAPDQFIPQAEQSDLILALGEWLFKQVCAQMRSWCDMGLTLVPVAVNVAVAQFQHQQVDQLLVQILERYNLDARYLELELTESLFMQDPEASLNWMQDIRRIGVALAIDDFGTGYSNLRYLQRFPVSKLKIDQTFVAGMTHNPEDRAIVTAIVRMAQSLGLTTLAKGVESEEQLRLLTEAGCDAIQGYYFRRPLAAQEAAALLREPLRRDIAL